MNIRKAGFIGFAILTCFGMIQAIDAGKTTSTGQGTCTCSGQEIPGYISTRSCDWTTTCTQAQYTNYNANGWPMPGNTQYTCKGSCSWTAN